MKPKAISMFSKAAMMLLVMLLTTTPAWAQDEQYNLGNLKGLISYGASPRGSINLALASKAYAFMRRRGYVIPEDVRAVCHDVMRHRLGLSYEAEANNISADEIISNIVDKIAVP